MSFYWDRDISEEGSLSSCCSLHIDDRQHYTEDKIFLKVVGKRKHKNRKHRKRRFMKARRTDSLSSGESMRFPGIEEMANWIDHVCESIENYTQDQIIETQIMLKDYQTCLLPEKRALEANDSGFARKVTHMEDMFKEILVGFLIGNPGIKSICTEHEEYTKIMGKNDDCTSEDKVEDINHRMSSNSEGCMPSNYEKDIVRNLHSPPEEGFDDKDYTSEYSMFSNSSPEEDMEDKNYISDYSMSSNSLPIDDRQNFLSQDTPQDNYDRITYYQPPSHLNISKTPSPRHDIKFSTPNPRGSKCVPAAPTDGRYYYTPTPAASGQSYQERTFSNKKYQFKKNISRAKYFIDSDDTPSCYTPCYPQNQNQNLSQNERFDLMTICIFMMSVTIFCMSIMT